MVVGEGGAGWHQFMLSRALRRINQMRPRIYAKKMGLLFSAEDVVRLRIFLWNRAKL